MATNSQNHHGRGSGSFTSRPFSDYEKKAIFDIMDDLRDSVRFSDASGGYPFSPDNATRLLRRAQRKLTALI